MLCEKCKTREANVHLVKIINGERREEWLCEECIKGFAEEAMFSSLSEIDGEEIKGSLDKLLGQTIQKNKEKVIDILCYGCGLKYSVYKKSGQLGCNKCYDSFLSNIKHVIKSKHGSYTHVGKIPNGESDDIKYLRTIRAIELNLKKAIANEEYENAARLRDEKNEFIAIYKGDKEYE